MMKHFEERAKKMGRSVAAMTEDTAYSLGYDAGLNGANLTNSNFSIFSRPEFTAAWERGNKDAKLLNANP